MSNIGRLFAIVACSALTACGAISNQTFSSASFSGPAFTDLLGEDGEQVTIFGILRLPRGEGPFPAVIYIHGSVGPQFYHETVWLSTFRSLGFATLQINSFLPRGVFTTIGQQDSVTEASLVRDVFAAAVKLSEHPAIDASRIGVMGSSKGGIAALVSGKQSFQRKWLPDQQKLAFHIALYPFCHTFSNYDFSTPVLVMSGSDDTWVGVENCAVMVEEMQAAAVDARFKLYPGAVHSWDSPLFFRLLIPGADGYANCRFQVQDDGTLIDLRSDSLLTTMGEIEKAVEGCAVSGGQYVGGDEITKKASVGDVVDFIDSLGYRRKTPSRPEPDF